MKKQTREAVPMRTFKFSCRVSEGYDLIHEIVNQGVDYYNARVLEREVELASQQDCLCEIVPGWSDLLEQEDELSEQVEALDSYFDKLKSKYGRYKQKPAEYNDIKAKLAALKAEKKEIWAQRKALKPVYLANFAEPNVAYANILKERSRDSSGRVHPLKISRNRPVVLDELAPKSSPAWVEHHRRVQAQATISRAYRRAGHHDSMDLVLSDVQRAVKDAGMKVPRKRRQNTGQVGISVNPPMEWQAIGNAQVKSRFWMEKQVDTGKRLRQDAALVPAEIRISEGKLIKLTVLQHRKIPDDARLCRVVLQAKQFKGTLHYYLCLTMEHPSFAVQAIGQGTVAVNFGWRKIGDSYLVATLVDDVGVSSQVVLPDEIPSSIEYAEHLISVRDRIFNEFRTDALSFGNAYKVFPQELLDGVKAFLESKGKHGNVQQSLAGISGGKFNWFLDRVIKAHLTDEQRALLWHQWLEKHFFDMEKWNAHPRGPKPDLWEPHFETFRSLFYGSEMSTEMVLAFWYETWRQKHMHLTSWANNQKAKAIRRRMDFYRNVAAKLSVQYERIVVDDTDFSKLARRLTSKQKESLPVEEVAIREQGNSHRFLVAPSELRDCMVYRFGKDKVIKVKAENVTKHHSKDGGDLVYLVGSDVGTCSHCGTVVNIDKNACENLLLRSGRWSNLDALHVDSDNDVANVEPDAMPMAGE